MNKWIGKTYTEFGKCICVAAHPSWSEVDGCVWGKSEVLPKGKDNSSKSWWLNRS